MTEMTTGGEGERIRPSRLFPSDVNRLFQYFKLEPKSFQDLSEKCVAKKAFIVFPLRL